MARFRAPYGRGVVTVSAETAKQYKAAGWVEVKDEVEKSESAPRRRRSKSADDEDK